MDGGSVRLAELLAALSLATDLGMGQPPGHAVQTCVLSVHLARHLGLAEAEISDVFYVSLLRYLGCTADASTVAELSGNEIALAAAVGPYVMGDVPDRVAHTAVDDPEGAMAAAMAVHCEAAGLLGDRLELGSSVTTALRHAFERWDGAGHPGGLAAEAIPNATRIAVLARDVLLWQRLGGASAARDIARQRRGKAYDPTVVDAYLAQGPLPEASWSALLAVEPAPRTVDSTQLDRVLGVIADFADLKVPCALGHSRRVSSLAAAAAVALGQESEPTALRRAGLVQDLGRAGVSNRIWDKPGPLSDDEWERVRLHPYYTERILRRCGPLAHLATMAGSHHEHLDGSGYHRGVRAAALDTSARILAVADRYATLREPRPHRPPCSAAAAVSRLHHEAEAGWWDSRAVNAVVGAAGEERPPPVTWPHGLTDREVEVLRLAVRGLTIAQVATRLRIAPKTVDRHLQNSYAKLGVTSRAGAALCALESGLLT
jgi:HD-GYP domain-containing protein (c-di-GMP phosphodiesterase class II)/DNA-binding CsgD family transcriptional regulator